METFAAVKLQEFEQGKISRRRLVEILTVAATASARTTGAAAETAGIDVALLNHISYSSPNFRQVADWYSKVFNLEQVNEKSNQVVLPLQKKGEKPLGITADDVGATFLVSRTPESGAPISAAAANRPQAKAVVGHLAYTVADFERDRVMGELKSLGLKNVRPTGPFRLHITDPFGFDIQISGLPLNAVTDDGA